MKYFSFLIFLFSINSFAQLGGVVAKPLSCSQNGITVLFVNGQENEFEHAFESANRISDLFHKVYGPTLLDEKYHTDFSRLRFEFIHNPTQGTANKVAIADFAESLALILQSELPIKLSRDNAWGLAYAYFNYQTDELATKYVEGQKVEITENLLNVIKGKTTSSRDYC